MEVIHRKCAGLDVHKDTVVACARVMKGAKVSQTVQTFGTTTPELMQLSDWLERLEVTHVVMESTGVYWRPVWHVLAGSFELILANAAQVKNIPGRKTDVNDATWLSDLLAHGLVKSSFVPDEMTQEIRTLSRTRKQLVREQVRHVQRVQKTLEDCNIKLSSVISDIMGKSGRAIVDAIVEGETNPEALLEHVDHRVRADRDHIKRALTGRVKDHHRFELRIHLKLIDELGAAIKEVEARIGDALKPFQDTIRRLADIPGLSVAAAQTILGEIGQQMDRFPTSGHLISWAGLCPRMDESAGKRRSTRTKKGCPWLKTLLVQAAWAAARTKKSYFRSQFLRLRARRGPMKAIVAVAASILTTVYHMLKNGSTYSDLGPDHFNKRNPARTANRLLRQLADLGFKVTVTPA